MRDEEKESAKRGRRIKRRRGRERESISEPPLLACRALMNANHDPEAARSTCCFPVQIAYNFYCHGRNSSLMEARLISVLVLRPSRVPCVLLPLSLALAPPFSPCFTLAIALSLSLACRSPHGFSPPSLPFYLFHLSRRLRFRFPISFLILFDQRHRALCRSYIRRI